MVKACASNTVRLLKCIHEKTRAGRRFLCVRTLLRGDVLRGLRGPRGRECSLELKQLPRDPHTRHAIAQTRISVGKGQPSHAQSPGQLGGSTPHPGWLRDGSAGFDKRGPVCLVSRLPDISHIFIMLQAHTTARTTLATWPLRGCGTRPLSRRAQLSPQEQGAAPQPARSAWPPP